MHNQSTFLAITFAALLTACGGGTTSAPDTVASGANAGPSSSAGAQPSANGNAGAPVAAVNWQVSDLGTLGAYAELGGSVPEINNRGQAVAVAASTPYDRASFLVQGASRTELSIPNRSVVATGINDAGHVVGYSFVPGRPSTEMYPFVYRDGQITNFGSLDSQARDINNLEQITGTAPFAAGSSTAFLYSNSTMTNLGALGSGNRSWGNAINDSGAVVGASLIDSADVNTQHAFVYRDGKMSDLGTLGDGTRSEAVAINNAGQVVGWSRISSNDPNLVQHAFLYSGGQLTDLGEVTAKDINNRGQIVGFSGTGAWIYQNGKFTDLNSLPGVAGSGWKLVRASAINDDGQIIGTGTLNGQAHAFLLSPMR